MWNLIGEVGAVVSPALGGELLYRYGTWTDAVYVDGALMIASAVLYLAVRERQASMPAPA